MDKKNDIKVVPQKVFTNDGQLDINALQKAIDKIIEEVNEENKK